ncbi:MAG: tail fiber domain-containing protein [Hyphomicrobiaceae bacterium]|nr:tail fiber domain-containing protein [Hyphomicrobiaceae bacterium]
MQIYPSCISIYSIGGFLQPFLSFSHLVRRASFHVSIAALVLGLPSVAYAAPCSVAAPMVANAKTDVVYDPIDSTMKACVAGTWLTMSGGGGGGNLDGLTDVVITTPSTNQALVYNGAAWVNATLSLTETDPKVGALTGNQWCAANAGGTAIVCNQSAPAAGASSSGAAGYVQLSDGAGGFTTSGATAGEELFWNNTSKRLGIGTQFPGQTLQLGTASVGQENYLAIGDANSQRLKIGYGHGTGIVDNNFSAQIIADGTGNLVLSSRTSSASSLQFYTNAGTDGVERMRISGSGNVGIGTTSPDASALLDVSSTTKGFLPPRMTTVEVTAVVTPADGLIVYDTDTDTIKLRANGAWVSLQAGGGVESDPQVGTLTATKWCAANAGGTAIDCTVDAPATGAAGSGSEVQFRDSGTGAFAANANFVWDGINTRLGIGTSSPGLAAGAGRSYLSVKGVSEGGILELIQAGADADAATIGGIQFSTDNNTNGTNGKRSAAIFVRQSGATANDRGGNLQFWTKADAGTLNLAMTITDAANVGIGTASPGAPLSFAAATGAKIHLYDGAAGNRVGMGVNASELQFFMGNSNHISFNKGGDLQAVGTNELMRIDASTGNVGIGTAGPTSKLHVDGTGTLLQLTSSGFGSLYAGTDVNHPWFGTPANHDIRLVTNATEKMRISAGGNIGIGTPTPTRGVLEVAGVVSATTAVFGTGNKGVSLITNWPGVYWNSYYNSGVKAMSSGYSANFSQNPTTGAMTLGISAAAATAADEASTHATLMTILSNGNVGIGSGSPAGLLHVNSSDYASILLGNNDAGGFHITKEPGDDSFNVWSGAFGSGTNRFKIASSGNVGIGTTDPKSRLDISDSNGIGALTLGREGGFIGYNTYYNGGWKYKVNGYGAILRLDTTGMQFHGAPNNASGNDAAMTARLNMLIAPAGNVTVYGATTTCTLGNGSGATNCTSDGRLKDQVEPLQSALDKLSAITPVTFHWKDKSKDQREFLGLIAQDVEKVYPQAVDEVSDTTIGTAKTLDYAVMVVPAIAAIKELKAANDNLRAENKELLNALNELRGRVEKLEYGK